MRSRSSTSPIAADTPAFELSGGMRRRLSLACALVHRPAVLFLDEPTVGIDPALRVQFWGYFRELAAAGTTLLVASHVMDEAERCDELLLFLHGRLLAQRLRRRDPGTRGHARSSRSAFLRLGGTERTAVNLRRTLAISRRIAGSVPARRADAGTDVRRSHRDHRPARLGHPRSGHPRDAPRGSERGRRARRADRPGRSNAPLRTRGSWWTHRAQTRPPLAKRSATAQHRRRDRSARRPAPEPGRAGRPARHHAGHQPRRRRRAYRPPPGGAPAGAGRRLVARRSSRETIYGAPGGDLLDTFAPALVGFVVYFLVFILTGISFLRERIGGTLERLLATPVRRSEIVTGYSPGSGSSPRSRSP